MSDHDDEQTPNGTPDGGGEIIEPDERDGELSDEEQGVGVAPTQPGDPADEHTAEGDGDTAFRPSSDFEQEAE